MALPINSIAQAFTEQQLANSRIGDIQADTQQRLMQTAMGNLEMQAFVKKQQALDLWNQFQMKEAMFQSAQNNPNAPADGMTPEQSELQQLTAQRDQYKKAFDYVSVALPDTHLPTTYLNALTRTDARIQQVTKQVQDKQDRDGQQQAQIIGGMNNQESMDLGFQAIEDKWGRPTALKLASRFPKDPDTGKPQWGDKAAIVRDQFVNQYTTVHEANTLRKEIERDKDRDERERERERHNRERERQIDEENARKQHALEEIFDWRRRREDADAAKAAAKQNKLTTAASKPATAEQKKSARSAIAADPDFEGVTLDQSIDALAADIADRAHKIRADTAKDGEDMGLDEARQQAWSELKPFVKIEESGGFMGYGKKKTARYVREVQENIDKDTSPDLALMRKLNAAGIGAKVSGGKVTGENGPVRIKTQAQMQLLPSGTVFIGPDGKQWTAP